MSARASTRVRRLSFLPRMVFDLRDSGTTLDMKKGHISLVPYYVVEQLVARGEVELV